MRLNKLSMIRKIFFLKSLLLILIGSMNVGAFETHRKCVLLPVNIEKDIDQKIFTKIEKMLKESNWCIYKSTSNLYDILKKYEKRLAKHLENKDVKKLLVQQSGSKSLIHLWKDGKNIFLKIFDEDEGINFHKTYDIDLKKDLGDLVYIIQKDLEKYGKSIPYLGLVNNVDQKFVTLDIGKEFGLKEGDRVNIYSVGQKKIHPLFKQTVEWHRNKLLCLGKVVRSNYGMTLLKLESFGSSLNCDKVATGDWVTKEKNIESDSVSPFPKKEKKYKKIGNLSVLFHIGSKSASMLGGSNDSKKMSGPSFGFETLGDILLTKNMVLNGFLSFDYNVMSEAEGSFEQDQQTPLGFNFGFSGGYRYYIFQSLKGPALDVSLGYARKSFPFDTETADYLTTFKFYGITLGGQIYYPVNKKYSVSLHFDFFIDPGFSQEIEIYLGDSSNSSYDLGFGLKYVLDTTKSFFSKLKITNSKATFSTVADEFKVNDLVFEAGLSVGI